jgi:hypothetical protein
MKIIAALSILLCCFFSINAQTLGSWNCLDFNGTTNEVIIPNQTSLNPSTAITVEAWIKADVWATSIFQGSIVAHDSWTSISEGWALRTGANGSLSFVIALNNNGSWYEAQSTAIMSVNKWYHVAGTYDGSVVKIYINGKEVGSVTQAGTITPSTVAMKIGNFPGPGANRYFDGQIDEVRIWNTALSQNTLRQYMCQYLNPSHPNYSGLLAYYNFDIGTGVSLLDLSGNGYNGAVSGATWGSSGAALGSESVYLQTTSWVGKNLALNHSSGDGMNITGVTGNPDGIHLYRVDNHPNFQVTPPGVMLFHDYRYWGVYPTSGTNVRYNLTYTYSGYPGLTNKDKLNLSYRTANFDNTWVGLVTVNDTVQNTLLKTSASQGEFILGTNDDLTAFNLASPVNSTTITVQGNATQTLLFVWSSSTVGGVGAPSYKWHLDYDTSDFSNPLRSYVSANSGLDTNKAVTYQELVTLMRQLGYDYGETLNAKWSAEALTGPLSRFANSAFDINFKRDIISTDAIYVFRLTLPVNDDTIKAVDGGSNVEIFNWSRANSTVGNNLTYEIAIAGHSGDFNNPVAVFTSDNNGADTLASISHADLATMLKGLNLQSGQVFRFKWRAKAEIASLQSYSLDSQFVYMYWEESPHIGIEENDLGEFEIFPNPAKGEIVIHADKMYGLRSNIDLLDETGKPVKTWGILLEKQTKLAVRDLKRGTYILRIQVGEYQSTHRVYLK